MDFYRKVRAQQDQVDDGTLKVSVFTEDGTRPVEDALVRISYTGESGQTVEEVRTDSSGQTPVLDLKTPPLEYSMEPVEAICGIYHTGRSGRIRKYGDCRYAGASGSAGTAGGKNGISCGSIV